MRRACCLLLGLALTASGQQAPVVETQVYVTAIDIVADVRDSRGNLPPGLTPDDFILLEEGVERKVIGVDYLRAERAAAAQPGAPASATATPGAEKPWQTVLYFETDLSNGGGRRKTAKELIKHADRLVQMGTVDVVLADPQPAALLLNSRDADAVRKALQTVAKSGGANQIALHRHEFLTYVQSMTGLEALKPRRGQQNPSNMSAAITSVDARIVRPYIEQEVQLVNRFRRNLISWLSNYSRYAPRTLVMVTDGYDIDPLEYYSANLNKGDELELRSYVTQAALSDATAKMAKALATAGWMTVSVQGDSFSDGWVDDASTSSMGRLHRFNATQPQPGPRALLVRPADPLQELADETGGDVVANSGKIGRALDRIDDRLRITYQVDRKPDGKPLKIELRARDRNLKVRSTSWAASSTPDEMAEQRALGQLHEGRYAGDLPLEATVDWTANTVRKQGTLRVVSKAAELSPGDFRFTLAVLVPPGEAFVANRNLSAHRVTDGVFRMRTPLDLPAATSVIVVSIEEIATGRWGSARIRVQ